VKLGLGLYRHMLTDDNLRFARQAGATHIVAHLVDYFSAGPRIPTSLGEGAGWGPTQRVGKPWTLDELERLKTRVETAGMILHAIENLDPGHWHDVLLDGPQRDAQIEQVLDAIRLLGEVGVPCLGYNFSLAGVWGHITGPFARGGAESIAFDADALGREPDLPCGQVWNMDFGDTSSGETIGAVDAEQVWSRFEAFLSAAVPVAERAGVQLCAHPDDPPVPRLRNTDRVLTSEAALQRLLDYIPCRANSLEFCQGTISEMPDVDIYDAIARFAAQDRIGYVHFRNVVGRAPRYHEVFLDEGDVDMHRALRAYAENGYDGVFIPDHTPQMTCDAPWHAGMAYALGYMRAAMDAAQRDTRRGPRGTEAS
jgi:mannonate dehydratase